MAWWLWIRSPIEANLLSGVFSPLTFAEACEKSSPWLWKEKLWYYWCEKARKHICVTDRHDMTSAVKVALNPIQPTNATQNRETENCQRTVIKKLRWIYREWLSPLVIELWFRFERWLFFFSMYSLILSDYLDLYFYLYLYYMYHYIENTEKKNPNLYINPNYLLILTH